MSKVILFAGTTEGRMLAQELCGAGIKVILCVATNYAKEIVNEHSNLITIVGRMDKQKMCELIINENLPKVIDATHPYAAEVTKNIREACEESGAEYIRLLREKSKQYNEFTVDTIEQAAEFLSTQEGKILLTIGSKELQYFTIIPNFKERVFARVLPMAEVVQKCEALGFAGRQLICMQGPFSHELNIAMLKEISADWLVTKDSGDTGGFYEKISAAEQTGTKLLLVRRPIEESGMSYKEIRQMFIANIEVIEENMPRFPLFIDLNSKAVAVIGGGKVATRRVETLLKCGAIVHLIAPEITENLENLACDGKITLHRKEYKLGYFETINIKLILVCTNNKELNAIIALEAKKNHIPCSVASNHNLGSFWFPAFISNKNFAVGLVSNNLDHAFVKSKAKQIKKTLEDINL